MSKLSKAIADAIFNAKCGYGYNEVLNGLTKDIDNVSVKVWREDESVKLPTYAHDSDACMDVYAWRIELKSDGRIVYHTGLHFKLPEGYEMEIRPRSSITRSTTIIQNSPGILDAGYTGELMVICRDLRDSESPIPHYEYGDRVAQIVIRQRERITWDEVDNKEELGETDRGDKGWGSTGK